MNLFDVLFMQKTGKIKPDADLVDILLAKKLGGAGVITTLVGNPLSFLAKKAQTAKSTKVTLEPVQEGSGDPSPTNIRPISGRSSVEIKGCGKNRIETVVDNVLYRNRVYSLTFNDNVIIFTPNTGASTSFFLLKAFKITSDMVGKTYTYSFNSSPQLSMEYSSFVICDDDGGNRVAKANGFTITDAYVGKNLTIRFYSSTSSVQAYTISQIQVEEGSATTYEPYTESNDVTISFGETIYGGTLDVETGVLTVDKAIDTFGSLSWTRTSTQVTGKYRFQSTIKKSRSTSYVGICSHLSRGSTYSAQEGYNWNSTNKNALVVYVEEYSSYTYTQFKNATSDWQICYALETPTTIQLTPSEVELLKGVNNIWTDGDEIELTYRA